MGTKRRGAQGETPVRVVLISRVKRNPYVALLCEGLRQHGLCASLSDQFSAAWMWRHRREVDVIHIHWLELFFVYPTLGRSLKRWLSVILGLILARLCGVQIVYTVHNLEQHEGQRATLSRWGHRVIFRLARAVHVHDEETASMLREQWGRRRGVYVIPHGNYISAYPNTCSRAEARHRLGIDDKSFVYLSLGRVRPYKGVEELLATFKSLPEPDALLLVAGEVQEAGYDRQIHALALGDARIRLQLQFVADDELQVYFQASDFCVLPYRHVTTSGAAILSFSFQTPIIAPRLGCFVQLVGSNGERGILYDAQSSEGLREALRQARKRDLKAMQEACVQYARQLDWFVLAQAHAAMYPIPGQHE